ncbi:hypothetical protein RD792_010902 [Penstemon davidsonii]|uniref:Leucine-rich repeat-containing N-terminal plant-type domain-containing protein n=1 Tax=Penstemon davidsonii TaxID=160366 RepID=A0ABR0D3Y7_9LAMI|nr:hypothetical protein RD792_010902 [Penstemon davidsonii]
MAAAVRLLLIPLLIVSYLTPSLATGEDIHLLDFKESLNDSSALDSTWRKGTHPCKDKWKGIECDQKDDDNVSGLILIGLGLSGVSEEMDIESLGKLDRLRFLSLENNSFTGRIPEFNRLTSLRSLFISGNQFSGEIAQDYFNNMGSLKKLEMARNMFSGTIPDSLGNLNNLVELFLERNEFSGAIPLIAQKSLQTINLSYNKLHGEIPQSMSKFGAGSFEGNPELCGPIISKPCPPQDTNVNAPPLGDHILKFR